ncbi:MAG: hypothetical protein AAGF12_18340 [Myxococcota bacterium]
MRHQVPTSQRRCMVVLIHGLVALAVGCSTRGLDAIVPGDDATTEQGNAPIPTPLYSNDFDQDIEGFTPTDRSTPPGFREASPGDFGGIFDEWWSPDLGDGDRVLTVFRSQSADTVRWRLRVENRTGASIEGIRLTYDAQVVWARFQAVDIESPEYGVRADHITWFEARTEEVLARAPDLVNFDVGPTELQRWLNNEEQEALGLLVRNVQHDLALGAAPGESIEVDWGLELGNDEAERHLNIGINNLVVTQLP